MDARRFARRAAGLVRASMIGCLCAVAPAGAWGQYIVDLGPMTQFGWGGLNDVGQAVGVDRSSQSIVVYSGGSVSTLLTSPLVVDVLAINNLGSLVTGTMRVGNDIHAALFSSAGAQDLGTLGGVYSAASGINDAGQVVGVSTTDPGGLDWRGFVYSNGSMTPLGTLGGPYSAGGDINASGQIVGQAQRAASVNGLPDAHAFLFSDGRMTDLGALLTLPPGAESAAGALNDRGQVVGSWRAVVDGQQRAQGFLYADGVMTELGSLGGGLSAAYDIDEQGRVVGLSTVSGGASHAFVYAGGAMKDLNDFAAGSGWMLQAATSISDSGDIFGFGTFNGEERWFLLASESVPVPAVPEPGTYVLFGGGLVALVAAMRRRRGVPGFAA